MKTTSRSVIFLLMIFSAYSHLFIVHLCFAAETPFSSVSAVEKIRVKGAQDFENLQWQYKQGNMSEPLYKAQKALLEVYYQWGLMHAEKVDKGELTAAQFDAKAKSFIESGNDLIVNAERSIAEKESTGKLATGEGLDLYITAINNATRLGKQELAKLNDVKSASGGAVAMTDTTKTTDPAVRLKKLKSLLDQGLITQADYEQQRQQIINSL